MVMKVTFAAASSGRSYFEKFIQDLSLQDRAMILAVFEDIRNFGFDAKRARLSSETTQGDSNS